MSFSNIPLADNIKTASLSLSVETLPAYSKWRGEVSLEDVLFNETFQPVLTSVILDIQTDPRPGLVIRRTQNARHNSDTARLNTTNRLFLEIENVSDAPLTLEDVPVTLWMLQGAPLPTGEVRLVVPALETNESPFTMKDGDGAEIGSFFSRDAFGMVTLSDSETITNLDTNQAAEIVVEHDPLYFSAYPYAEAPVGVRVSILSVGVSGINTNTSRFVMLVENISKPGYNGQPPEIVIDWIRHGVI